MILTHQVWFFRMQRWLYGEAIGGLKTVSAGADLEKLVLAIGFAVLFGLIHALTPSYGKSLTMVHGCLA